MCACRKENAGKKDTECQGKPLAIFIVRIMLHEWERRRRPRRRRRRWRCCAKATRANVSAYKNSHFNICQLAALAADLPHAAPRTARTLFRSALELCSSRVLGARRVGTGRDGPGLFACHFICAQQLALFAVPATSRVDFCVWATFQLQLIYFICPCTPTPSPFPIPFPHRIWFKTSIIKCIA